MTNNQTNFFKYSKVYNDSIFFLKIRLLLQRIHQISTRSYKFQIILFKFSWNNRTSLNYVNLTNQTQSLLKTLLVLKTKCTNRLQCLPTSSKLLSPLTNVPNPTLRVPFNSKQTNFTKVGNRGALDLEALVHYHRSPTLSRGCTIKDK